MMISPGVVLTVITLPALALPALAPAQSDSKPAGQGKNVKPNIAFAELQAAARRNDASDAAVLARGLPEALVAERPDRKDDVAAWRAAVTEELGAAKVASWREKGDEAVVRFTVPPALETRELPMRLVDSVWQLAAAQSYVVLGQALDERRGSKPARMTLAARTTADGYDKSGLSFTHVTSDPQECKNRMDLWFCHNGDLHLCGNNRIADLGAQKLSKIDGLPVGTTWSGFVSPKKGNAYVVHCRSEARRDFYVKFVVVDVSKASLVADWTLLTDGLHAPSRIDAPQPLVSDDGADGADGLCAKRGG